MSGLILLCKDVSPWLGANLNSAQSVFVPRSCRLVRDILLRKAKQHLAHIFFCQHIRVVLEIQFYQNLFCTMLQDAREYTVLGQQQTTCSLQSCNCFPLTYFAIILRFVFHTWLYYLKISSSYCTEVCYNEILVNHHEFCFNIFETSATSEEAAIVTAICWKLVATQFNLILLHLCFGSTSLNTAPCVELHNCWSNTNGRVSIITYATNALQSRHNGRDHVSNHQPNDCLLNRLFRRYRKGHDGRL